MSDYVSDAFSAEEGDEYDITIEAGGDGADVGVIPQEEDGITFGDQVGWGWSVEPDETIEETIEIEEDDDYVFMISAGSAEVEAETV